MKQEKRTEKGKNTTIKYQLYEKEISAKHCTLEVSASPWNQKNPL